MRPDTAAALELPVTGDSVGPVAVQFSYSATWRDSSVRPGERLQRLARETLSPEVGGRGGWWVAARSLWAGWRRLPAPARPQRSAPAPLQRPRRRQASHPPLSPTTPQHLEVHWFAIANAVVTVLLLTGFLASILLRVLKADVARYTAGDGLDDADETGWK